MDASSSTTNNGTTPSNKTRFESLTLQQRIDYATDLVEKNKGHVPIVLEKHKSATLAMGNAKKLLVVGSSLKVMNFMEFIRRYVKLHSSSGLFLFVNGNSLARTSDLIGELYTKYASKDNFLYITVSDKEIWG